MDKGAYQKSMMDIAKRSYKFIYRSNSNREKQLCDILIEPQEILLYNGASIRDKDQMFTIGYDETTSILNEERVEKLLKPWSASIVNSISNQKIGEMYYFGSFWVITLKKCNSFKFLWL